MPPQTLSLKGRALKYLAMREHSRMELRRKLALHASPEDDLDALLDHLEQQGWLSAERFVASVIHRKASRLGMVRLQQELARHGLPRDMTQAAVGELQQSEYQRAHDLWVKRFGEVAIDPQAQARQARFLMSRGFTGEVIRQVLRDVAKR